MNMQSSPAWKSWAPDWRTFFSGILIVLSFPPWNFWPLIWIALVPWFSALQRTQSLKESWIQGMWLSFFMSMGGFYWVAFVLQEFGGVPWILSILGLLIFSVFGQLQFHLFAPIWKHFSDSRTKSRFGLLQTSVVFALAYAGSDWILPKLFMDTLGHSFYRATYFRQLADLGGASLLTFYIYWVNESVWVTWIESLRTKRFKLSPQLALVLGFCVLGWGYGWVRYDSVHQKIQQSQKGLQAAAIQANIGDLEKLASERGARGAAEQVIQTFIELSDQANQLTPRPQVLIWPETSYPSTFRTPHSNTESKLDQEVESYARKIGLPLLFGGYDHFQNKDFNAFFFLSPQGDLQIYRKNILLLFGEYIPGADRIDWIRNTFPQVGNFGRGEGPQVLSVQTETPRKDTAYAGPIICYEALFPNYVIEAAKKGSEFIINITNDSWFGDWGEPQLHLALTTFRSIETRLPMIRSTNTGISALITAQGDITHATQIGRPEVMNVYIPLTAPIPTLMKMWGDWFGPTAFGLGWIGIGLFAWLKSRHSHLKLKRKSAHGI